MSEESASVLEEQNRLLRLRVEELELRLHQAEADREAGRAAVAQLDATFQVLPDLYFRVDPLGKVLDFRAGTAGDLYAPPEVFMGKRLRDVLPPEVAAIYEAGIEESLAAPGKARVVEYKLAFGAAEEWFEGRVMATGEHDLVIFVRKVTAHHRDREALRRLNAELEDRIRERTEAMAATLRELSAPVIPIARGVIAVPLIGTASRERTEQLVEVLLQGVARQGARTVLLDLTGVPSMEADVADALVRVARGVGLLGARLVLTGIRPEVARTLVEIAADLSEISTQQSLEQGIAFALGLRRA